MADTVAEFLAELPEVQRKALERLRKQIRSVVPGAEELINYGVPMFRLDGRNLVSFAAAKTHCSFFVQSPSVMDLFAAELDGFDTSRGTIRFQPGRPVPAALIKKIVSARIAENAAIASKRS